MEHAGGAAEHIPTGHVAAASLGGAPEKQQKQSDEQHSQALAAAPSDSGLIGPGGSSLQQAAHGQAHSQSALRGDYAAASTRPTGGIQTEADSPPPHSAARFELGRFINTSAQVCSGLRSLVQSAVRVPAAVLRPRGSSEAAESAAGQAEAGTAADAPAAACTVKLALSLTDHPERPLTVTITPQGGSLSRDGRGGQQPGPGAPAPRAAVPPQAPPATRPWAAAPPGGELAAEVRRKLRVAAQIAEQLRQVCVNRLLARADDHSLTLAARAAANVRDSQLGLHLRQRVPLPIQYDDSNTQPFPQCIGSVLEDWASKTALDDENEHISSLCYVLGLFLKHGLLEQPMRFASNRELQLMCVYQLLLIQLI